jgi:hypothetical protein
MSTSHAQAQADQLIRYVTSIAGHEWCEISVVTRSRKIEWQPKLTITSTYLPFGVKEGVVNFAQESFLVFLEHGMLPEDQEEEEAYW